MNILPLVNFNQKYDIKNSHTGNGFGLHMPAPLMKDTVSFTANPIIHKNRQAVYTVGERIKANIKDDILHRLEPLSRIFFDVTNSIGEELAPWKISFNRNYAIRGLLKSDDSTLEKMMRNGDLSSVPDQIRTTLFSKDFYDLSIVFDRIIPAYAQRGFILDSKNPDVEICMKGIDKKIGEIPEQYRFAAKGQRNSGIEQVQIRFINKNDKSKKPAKHELIIIPGYEYAKAKHYESKYIYSNTRKLNELNFIKRGSESDRNVTLAKRYNELIKNILNLEISRKIFDNAKNKDLYEISQEIPVNISDNEAMLVRNYFADVRKCMNNYYKTANERAKTAARLEELERFFNEDIEKWNKARDNILGNDKTGDKGAIEFFNGGEHKKDPFKK